MSLEEAPRRPAGFPPSDSGTMISDALEAVAEAAQGNQMDPEDNHGDDSLVDQLKWQEEAIRTLVDFVTNHGEALDKRFGPALVEIVRSDPSSIMDIEHSPAPTPEDGGTMTPMKALAICLELAAGEVATSGDDDKRSIRDVVAPAVAAWLLKEHGATIESEVKTIDIGPAMGG